MQHRRSLELLLASALLTVLALPFGINSGWADPVPPPEPNAPHRAYYPPKALRLSLTGRIGLEYSCDEKGQVHNIVVVESAGQLLDDAAKKLLSDQHCKLAADRAASGDEEKRLRLGVIFEMTTKPKVPRFEDNRQTIVITGSGLPGS